MIAKTGDTVAIHYRGTLDDGTEFDASAGRDPLSFTLGSGQVIKGFDDGVTGMTVGEKKTIRIPAEEAYGVYDEEKILEIDRAQVPTDITLEPGMQLALENESGQSYLVTVTEIGDRTVTLDANHALAGKALTFELELISVN